MHITNTVGEYPPSESFKPVITDINGEAIYEEFCQNLQEEENNLKGK